jgi:hypothetical protein
MFHSNDTSIENELDYFAQSSDPFLVSKTLSLPQVQGAVFIQQCEIPCYVDGTAISDSDTCLDHCTKRTHSVKIFNNDFEENQSGIALFA